MYGFLVAMGVGTALIVGIVSWAVTRRYGWRLALTLPLLALLSMVFLLWRASLLNFHDGISMAAGSVVFAAPTLVGALLGIVMASRR